jgi:hypothetical protein
MMNKGQNKGLFMMQRCRHVKPFSYKKTLIDNCKLELVECTFHIQLIVLHLGLKFWVLTKIINIVLYLKQGVECVWFNGCSYFV